MQAIIIEDEKNIMEQLVESLKEADSQIFIKKTISTVEEGIDYLMNDQDADIIFSDVQLTDGLSFEIFNATKSRIPVIFITGFDQFIMNAFEHNGIDYLLKPVDTKELSKAITKYKLLEKHFIDHQHLSIEHFSRSLYNNRKRSRIVVRKGNENISLRLEDVVLFYTESKVVFVLDKNGKKYLCDKNLGDLENELDQTIFFRANRQNIVNINFIKSYKSFERVKLQLDLIVEQINHSIIISQETAPIFRKWITEC